MSGESPAAAAFGYSVLGTFGVLVLLTVTRTIDDVAGWLLTAMFTAEQLHTLAAGAVVLVMVVVVAFAGLRSAGHVGAHGLAGMACDGTCLPDLDGMSEEEGRKAIKAHEDGHQDATKRAGGGGSTVHIWPTGGGGWAGKTVFHDPDRVAALPPEKKIAISLAGIVAAPNTTSPTDIPHAKLYAREADSPGWAMREGRKLAKRWVG